MKRTVLMLAALALLCSALSGCAKAPAAGNGGKVVNVYNWGLYIDETTLSDFEAETGIKVNYSTFESNETLYSKLKGGGADYDVIIPSDYMLARFIEEGMLQKIDLTNIPNFKNIDSEFQTPDYDPKNEYSVPYTWGTVGLIYNTTVVEGTVDSWAPLFDEKYAGKILMFNNPRDAVAIALKYLGYSLNTTSEREIMEAYGLLREKKPITQAYVMDQIFDKLTSGEAALGPYYAGDAITMIEENPDLAFCIPKEGANKFVDAFCIPRSAENKAAAEAFINFMCSPEISARNVQAIGYSTPIAAARALLDPELSESEIAYPPQEVLKNCEGFINLPKETRDLYATQWSGLLAS